MLVRDVMRTTFVTVEPHLSLRKAAAYLLQQQVNMAPVVTGEMRLVGVIGLDNILRQPLPSHVRAEVGKYKNGDELAQYLDTKLVSHVMRRHFWTLTEHASVSQAIATMTALSASFAPVVDAECVVGIVTRSDLMRAILEILANR